MQPAEIHSSSTIQFLFSRSKHFICGIYYFNKFVLHHANVHSILLKTKSVSYIFSGKEQYISSDLYFFTVNVNDIHI